MPAKQSVLLQVLLFLAFKERDHLLFDVKVRRLEAVALEDSTDPGFDFARFSNASEKAI